MDNQIVKDLLSEYSVKREAAILKSEDFKRKIYKEFPRLEKIDNEIARLSIDKIQAILNANNSKMIDEITDKVKKLQTEREEILKKNNINKKDFNPKFECKKCGDTGFAMIDGKNDLCSCIKQRLYNIEYNASNIYDLQNQNFDNFKLDYYSNEVDKERYGKDISPKKNIEGILKICKKFIEKFDDANQNNLLLSGSPGLGKTFLSSCIANEMIKKGKTVLYQTAPVMFDVIINDKFGKTNSNILNNINTVDLLIIDDLGTEAINNMKTTELFNVINTRLLNQENKITKTIISTNLTLQELYNTYEERIVSRIIGNYDSCYFFGEDIRIAKKLKK